VVGEEPPVAALVLAGRRRPGRAAPFDFGVVDEKVERPASNV